VRLTARGWQAIFFGALSLFSARLFGTTQLYQLAYAIAGLFLVALVLGFVLSRGLGYTHRIPAGERFVAGEPSYIELVVSNASWTRSPSSEVMDHLPKRHLLEMPPVEGRKQCVLRESALFARRGLYELGPAEIRTTDPFGLLRFVRRFETREEVVVYPKVFDLLDFSLWGRGVQTGAQSALARRGDEFSDLREYRWGDEWRRIHWKSVARTGELIVKEFAQNPPQRHSVVLDLHRAGIGAPEAEIEDAISTAGSVLKHLAQDGLPFRLLFIHEEHSATPFGADEAAYWRALALLATAQADGKTKPETFIEEVLRGERDGLGESVALVLRSLDDDTVRSARSLRAAGLSVVVIALATHTYRRAMSASSSGREDTLSKHVRQLELAGVTVRVVHRPGGVSAFAQGQRRRAAGARGAM
jgi:uncharacterized protein (DUF58 family)